MRSIIRATVLATVSVLALGGAAQAKTLVYCSEGSPEGFDPAPWTAGTTFDASSRTVYDRLIEFKHGSTETEPGRALRATSRTRAARPCPPATAR